MCECIDQSMKENQMLNAYVVNAMSQLKLKLQNAIFTETGLKLSGAPGPGPRPWALKLTLPGNLGSLVGLSTQVREYRI